MLIAEWQKGVLFCNGLGYGILHVLNTVCENLTSDIYISFCRNFLNVKYLKNQVKKKNTPFFFFFFFFVFFADNSNEY